MASAPPPRYLNHTFMVGNQPSFPASLSWSTGGREHQIRRFAEAQDDAKKAWDSLFSKSEQKQIAKKSLEAFRNPQQLAMFTPAEQLRAIVPGDAEAARRAGLFRADENLWADKLSQSKRGVGRNVSATEYEEMMSDWRNRSSVRTLYDDIAKSGVKEPVWVGHPPGATGPPKIIEGHHRIASAADINPKMEVPVRHYERNWLNAKSPQGVPHLSETKRFAPNLKIARQLVDFGTKWGRQALYAMMRAPK